MKKFLFIITLFICVACSTPNTTQELQMNSESLSRGSDNQVKMQDMGDKILLPISDVLTTGNVVTDKLRLDIKTTNLDVYGALKAVQWVDLNTYYAYFENPVTNTGLLMLMNSNGEIIKNIIMEEKGFVGMKLSRGDEYLAMIFSTPTDLKSSLSSINYKIVFADINGEIISTYDFSEYITLEQYKINPPQIPISNEKYSNIIDSLFWIGDEGIVIEGNNLWFISTQNGKAILISQNYFEEMKTKEHIIYPETEGALFTQVFDNIIVYCYFQNNTNQLCITNSTGEYKKLDQQLGLFDIIAVIDNRYLIYALPQNEREPLGRQKYFAYDLMQNQIKNVFLEKEELLSLDVVESYICYITYHNNRLSYCIYNLDNKQLYSYSLENYSTENIKNVPNAVFQNSWLSTSIIDSDDKRVFFNFNDRKFYTIAQKEVYDLLIMSNNGLDGTWVNELNSDKSIRVSNLKFDYPDFAGFQAQVYEFSFSK